MKDLQDKWIVITGASKGLGREMALVFAEAGANLVLTARSRELLDAVAAEVAAFGVECVTVVGDLCDEAILGEVKAICLDKQIDVLVNNAGIVDITPLEDVSDQRVRDLIEINLLVPIQLTKAVIGLFKGRRSGVIVNINSAGGKRRGAQARGQGHGRAHPERLPGQDGDQPVHRRRPPDGHVGLHRPPRNRPRRPVPADPLGQVLPRRPDR